MIAKAGTGSSFGGALGYLLSGDKQPEVIHSQELFSRAVEDGKRLTSASRVHRELSRPKLERRFGLSLGEHRAADAP